ncbi:MAG: hypothetical protein GEU97_02040 [Actinophytocola sp.]|nr:hypothetical protein [Actinophytocola sp.]
MSRSVVYLHVGAPKTGTTYLQGILWKNRKELASRGVFVPGRNHVDHFRAGFDLRGVEKDPRDPRKDWQGAWGEIARKIKNSKREIAVVSDERLAACTPEEVRRAVDSLAPAEVHVIYVTRDPAGLLSAEWQEHIKHGDKRAFDAWLDNTLNPKGHEWYWKVHGVGDVLRRWGTSVPNDRLHLLTLPRRGSDPELLWQRFCSVLGISPDDVDTEGRANVSLGVEGAELLRRVNEVMPDEFPRWHRIGVTREMLAHRILAPRAQKTSIGVPERLADKVDQYTEQLIVDIKNSGCDVVGDLDELNAGPVKGGGVPDELDVTSAAVDGVAGLVVQIGKLRDELREARSELADERERRKIKERMAARAWGLLQEHRKLPPKERVKRCVVELGDQSRMVGSALKVYRKVHPNKD